MIVKQKLKTKERIYFRVSVMALLVNFTTNDGAFFTRDVNSIISPTVHVYKRLERCSNYPYKLS